MLRNEPILRRPDEAVCWCRKVYKLEDFTEDTLTCECGMIVEKPFEDEDEILFDDIYYDEGF